MASRRTPPGGEKRPRKSRLREDRPSKDRPGLEPAVGGLGSIRNSIDAIDARIHALLNERAASLAFGKLERYGWK